MDQSPESLPATDLLLAHTEFLSALSARLVASGADADDLAQETWLSALRHPPAEAGAVRAWLAKVARNHALQAHRSRRRRAAREQWVARPEGLPSTEEIVARENARRGVVESLHHLSEPYRSTLLLRFYEDLPPREVARRMNVPVETARTRIKRGLALLREELDRRNGGDRGAWMSALLPLALADLPAPQAGPSATLAPFALPFGLLALLAAALLWAVRSGGDSSRTAARPAPQLAASGPAEASAAPAVRTDVALAAARRARRVRLVYDDDGAAAVGLEARTVPLGEGAAAQGWTSDADGRAPHDVWLASGDRVSVAPALGSRSLERTLDADALVGDELELRVQRASSVRGRVVDDRSLAVAGVPVWAAAPTEAHLEDGEPRAPLARCVTDAAGEFTLLELPLKFYVHAGDSARTVTRGAHIQGRAPRAHQDLELRLERAWELSGRVIDASGAPLASVRITTATHDLRGPGRAAATAEVSWRNLLRGAWTSGPDGRFEIRGLAPIGHNLVFSREGYALVERRITESGRNETVVLARAAEVSVELRASDGALVEGEVTLVSDAGGESKVTTVDGRATLALHPEATVVLLRARAAGQATQWASLEPVGRSQWLQQFRFRPARPLSVRVVDARGAPVVGAAVAAAGAPRNLAPWPGAEEALDELLEFSRLSSDAGGFAVFDGAPQESVAVEVSAVGFAPTQLSAPLGVDSLTAVLEEAILERPRLRLVARDSVSGALVEECVVTARTDAASGPLSLDVRFDGEGQLELPQDGVWTLYAAAEGRAPSVRRWRAGAEQRIEFDLPPQRTVRVRARDLRGEPIHPARLLVTDENGVPLPTAISSTYWANYIEMPEDGELVVRGLPATRVRFALRSAQLEGVEPVLVDLRDERESQVVLEIPADLSSPRARLEVEWPETFSAEELPARTSSARSRRSVGARLVVWDSSGALCGRHRLEVDEAGVLTFAHPWTMMSLRFDADGVCEAASQQRLEADLLFSDFGPRVGGAGDRVSLLVPVGGGRVALQVDGEELFAARFAPPYDSPVRLSVVAR